MVSPFLSARTRQKIRILGTDMSPLHDEIDPQVFYTQMIERNIWLANVVNGMDYFKKYHAHARFTQNLERDITRLTPMKENCQIVKY